MNERVDIVGKRVLRTYGDRLVNAPVLGTTPAAIIRRKSAELIDLIETFRGVDERRVCVSHLLIAEACAIAAGMADERSE